jgi:RNA 2',3'-cyclic 3'-phosphodiesterase
MRLFFAAFPPIEVRRQLEAAAAALDLSGDARRLPVENCHMTIAFAGEASRDQAAGLRSVGAALHSPSFEVNFDRYEHWPKAEVIVVAANECPAALHDLHRRLRADCARWGFAEDSRSLRPHMTIARKVAQAPVLKAVCKFTWRVRSFQLVRSSRSTAGSVYTVVDQWRLLDETD